MPRKNWRCRHGGPGLICRNTGREDLSMAWGGAALDWFIVGRYLTMVARVGHLTHVPERSAPGGGAMSEVLPADRPFVYRRNTSDEAVIRQIFHDRDYDLGRLRRGSELLAFWRSKAAAGLRPLIVDAGANIGASSVYFNQQFPDALIFAIEPDRENFEFLTRNVAGLPVSCCNGAVTSRPGRVKVVDTGAGNWGFRTTLMADGEVNASAVESVQVDRILDMYSRETYPLIVKIDIEGAEDELFSCNIEWLDRVPLIIIELHDWLLPKRRTSGNFLKAIAPLDRDFVCIGENIFSIDNSI
jgi:FkbM family methyltransferase